MKSAAPAPVIGAPREDRRGGGRFGDRREGGDRGNFGRTRNRDEGGYRRSDGAQ